MLSGVYTIPLNLVNSFLYILSSFHDSKRSCSIRDWHPGTIFCFTEFGLSPKSRNRNIPHTSLSAGMAFEPWHLSCQWQHQAMGRDRKGSRDPRARDRCPRLALIRVDRHHLGEAHQGQMSPPLPASAVNQDLRITTQMLLCPLTFP